MDASITSATFRCVYSLAWREVVRFLRQRNRVIGAVGQPLLFWLLFGTGLNQSFRFQGSSFSEYFIPGTLVLILLFTAIFATISIIEDRQEGFLQAVLVAPVPRVAFVLGKVAGGTLLAVMQALIFLLLSRVGTTSSAPWAAASLPALVALMTLVAIGFTALGFCIAWRLDSTQGFHAIMNLLLMPMWLLSGAFFPVPRWQDGTWGERVLNLVMGCNPVTYAVAGLRRMLSATPDAASEAWSPPLAASWLIAILFAGAMLLMATRMSRVPATGDYR